MLDLREDAGWRHTATGADVFNGEGNTAWSAARRPVSPIRQFSTGALEQGQTSVLPGCLPTDLHTKGTVSLSEQNLRGRNSTMLLVSGTLLFIITSLFVSAGTWSSCIKSHG